MPWRHFRLRNSLIILETVHARRIFKIIKHGYKSESTFQNPLYNVEALCKFKASTLTLVLPKCMRCTRISSYISISDVTSDRILCYGCLCKANALEQHSIDRPMGWWGTAIYCCASPAWISRCKNSNLFKLIKFTCNVRTAFGPCRAEQIDHNRPTVYSIRRSIYQWQFIGDHAYTNLKRKVNFEI